MEEIFGRVDAALAEGPEGWQTFRDLFDEALAADPQLLGTFIERYSSHPNPKVAKRFAAELFEVSGENGVIPLDPESANLIWTVVEQMPNWDDAGAVENCVNTIAEQAARDIPWAPPDSKPPVLQRFLLHCLCTPDDEDHAIQSQALDVVWKLHQWAEPRGGLRAVFSDSERQEIRAEVASQGIEAEAKPLLDLL